MKFLIKYRPNSFKFIKRSRNTNLLDKNELDKLIEEKDKKEKKPFISFKPLPNK